jgi:hypothetical protein
MISIIETSALQKLRQRDGPYKAQQRPGQSDVHIEIPSRNQSKDGTETNDNGAQYVNRNSPIGSAGAAAYAIQAQETTGQQADIK